MVGLREKLRRWHDSEDDGGAGALAGHSTPEFTFIRTDTHTAEVIHPPSADGHLDAGSHFLSAEPRSDSRPRRSLDVFRSSRSRSASVSSNHSSGHKRLSERLHLSRSPPSSENVPQDLPEIVVPEGGEEDKDGTESQWEKRATILARENEKHRSRPGTPVHGSSPPALSGLRLDGRASEDLAPPLGKAVSSKEIDADIQEAIRLHEEGRLEESTAIFGRLADPKGANNPLSQVLYGLALRCVHASAIPPTPKRSPTRLLSESLHARAGLPMHVRHAGVGASFAGVSLATTTGELANDDERQTSIRN
jgi:hypothetical protein